MFAASVWMLSPWSDIWIKKPTLDDVLEAFADAVKSGNIDELFQVKIEEVSYKVRGGKARRL
jgi:hypothetical protein